MTVKFALRQKRVKVTELTFHLDIENGHVSLYASDNCSKTNWKILGITKGGILKLEQPIPVNIGLQLTQTGHILISRTKPQASHEIWVGPVT